MTTTENGVGHVYRHEPVLAGEERLLSEYAYHGMKVLDVGCAATGRSARLLQRLGCDVVSIDINRAALLEFQNSGRGRGILLVRASMIALPFREGLFDLVVIAFHGFDYLLYDSHRVGALREFTRVLSGNGSLILNSFNRIGLVLSPTTVRSRKALAWKVRHICALRFLKRTFVDPNRLELYQSIPGRFIRQVRAATGLEFVSAIGRHGRTTNLILLALFSSGPYLVFARQDLPVRKTPLPQPKRV